MDLTKLSSQELKALAYDELKKANAAQSNIKLIEEVLADQAKQVPKESPVVEKKK